MNVGLNLHTFQLQFVGFIWSLGILLKLTPYSMYQYLSLSVSKLEWVQCTLLGCILWSPQDRRDAPRPGGEYRCQVFGEQTNPKCTYYYSIKTSYRMVLWNIRLQIAVQIHRDVFHTLQCNVEYVCVSMCAIYLSLFLSGRASGLP